MTLSLLEQGIQAAQAGQHQKARALLARAVRENPDSEQAWLGLAAVVDDDWQKLHCLRQAQRINPHNQAAASSIEALTSRLDVPAVRPESSSSEQDPPVLSSSPATPQEDQPQPVGAESPGPEITAPAPPVSRSGGSSRWIEAGVFVAQRLLFGGVILLAITFLTYLGLDMAEGTSLQEALVHATENTIAYIGRFLQGDLGTSVAGSLTYASVPIAQVVIDVVAKSLGLLAVALALAAIVGVPLGFWAARRRHTGWSLVILLVSIIGVSIPSFFAALLLQLILIRWTRAFGRPLLPVGGFGWDERIILPALVLVLVRIVIRIKTCRSDSPVSVSRE